MTNKARSFLAANKQSPVVYGSVIDDGGKGCFYRLADGKIFRLTVADCRAVGHPKWAHDLEIIDA